MDNEIEKSLPTQHDSERAAPGVREVLDPASPMSSSNEGPVAVVPASTAFSDAIAEEVSPLQQELSSDDDSPRSRCSSVSSGRHPEYRPSVDMDVDSDASAVARNTRAAFMKTSKAPPPAKPPTPQAGSSGPSVRRKPGPKFTKKLAAPPAKAMKKPANLR